MYVRSPIYRKIRDVIQSCKINAVATFLGGMLRNDTITSGIGSRTEYFLRSRLCTTSSTSAVKPVATMQIFVKGHTGTTVALNVGKHETVDEIKIKIREKVHMPPNHQRLFYAGKVLQGCHTLDDYNIVKESTIHLSGILLGGAPPSKKRFTSAAFAEEDDEKENRPPAKKSVSDGGWYSKKIPGVHDEAIKRDSEKAKTERREAKKRKVTPSSTSMITATGYAFRGTTTLSTTAPSSNSICAFSAAAASSSFDDVIIDLVDSTDEEDSIWIIPCPDSVVQLEDDISWAADSGNKSDGDKNPLQSQTPPR